MSRIYLLMAVLLVTIGCKKEPKTITENKTQIPAISQNFLDNAIVYEANIRQYSPEGTFNAFTQDIPKLKKMGIKVIWLMPIHEIGITNRKASKDTLISELPLSNDKDKYLGNPYSVKDYRSINANFGSKDDLKKLIETAHKNGIYVILDWVANHTAWDHQWITQHSDYYIKNNAGEIIHPYDWKDVAELNYDNQNLRKAMFEEMKYWIQEFDIDGFRCNVAAEIPIDFWNKTTLELQKIKPVFMLAEAEKSELLEKAFNVQYAWEGHYILNSIAQGKKSVKDFDDYIIKMNAVIQNNGSTLNFITNHDENSWNGSEYERMGDAVETFTALTFVMPGVPLIYNGQEYDLTKKLKFFEKDTILHTIGKMNSVYEKLGKLKLENTALNGGKNAASYNRLTTSDDVRILAFEREKSGQKVIFISNLTKDNSTFTVPIEGTFADYMSGQKITLTKDQKLDFKPWEYKILIIE